MTDLVRGKSVVRMLNIFGWVVQSVCSFEESLESPIGIISE